MKSFRSHINEEVRLNSLYSGGIDIERDAVRDEINGILASVSSKPCVTPYNTLNRVRKALAYFSIHLPKKVYMEGNHGVEVWELSQFGDKMGMTDQGEFIRSVPAKYYLFFHYHRIGSMYYIEAKIVDSEELEKKINTAESMVAEGVDASCRQTMAKSTAPKEEPHTALGDCDCSQGDSPSTKQAVEVSMRRKNMKESRMPASVIASKQKYANMSDKEFAEKHGHKSEKQLRDMAARHGYGFDKETKTGSDHYVKRAAASKQIDEKAPPGAKFERMVKHIKKGYSKDGLTAKEKSIAYATAWKAKKKSSD